jgi:hypothetical protein
VTADEQRMGAYDSADEKSLGCISMIAVEVNGDVNINDIPIFEWSTVPRLASRQGTCDKFDTRVWYSVRDDVVDAGTTRPRESRIE